MVSLSAPFQLFDYFYDLDLVSYLVMQGSQTEYSLFGSIVHAGFSQDTGHYYAYIKVYILLSEFNNVFLEVAWGTSTYTWKSFPIRLYINIPLMTMQPSCFS